MKLDLQNSRNRDLLVEQLSERIKELEEGIQEVLDDEESRPGAWGPDVTCVGKLQKLIKKEGG